MKKKKGPPPTLSLFLLAVIGIPNAYIQTDYDETETQVMKVRGELALLMCEVDPTYKEYIVYEGKEYIVYEG